MNVSINVNIVEELINLHLKRGENQKCIYALLIGEINGYNSYKITDCLYRFIFFNENYKSDKKEGDKKKVNFFLN